MDERTEDRGPAPAADGFEEVRRAVLDAALKRAAFDGWTQATVDAAARDAGVAPAALAAALPGGAADLLAFWSEATDEAMADAMRAPTVSALRIRDKVAHAISVRIDLLRPHKEAARRAAATLALPVNAALGARLAWRTADAIWRSLDDPSTDFAFYTKRATLTGVWTSTAACWLADDDPLEERTRRFLHDRIADVMRFEKFKAQVRSAGFDPAAPFRWLAKLRYPGAAEDRAAEDARVDEALKESFPASDPPYWTAGRP